MNAWYLPAVTVATLSLAAPASAHSIDPVRAAAAVRESAAQLTPVERVECHRPLIAGRRAPHRALCGAWWSGECHGTYEVRLAGRSLRVIQTYRPWCATFPG